MRSWLPRLSGSNEGGRITDFIDGLGPGQLVGRQALASPSLGDIQLSMADRRGNLEVEVIRARGLVAKLGSKVGGHYPFQRQFTLSCFPLLDSSSPQRLTSKFISSKGRNV